MKTIVRQKLYNNLFEIRGYERDKALRNNELVKAVLDDQYMLLTPKQLREDGIFINQQKSVFNGKMYDMWGYRFKPTQMIDTDFAIDQTTKVRLSQMYKEILKKKGANL